MAFKEFPPAASGMTLLASNTLTSATQTITFSGISSGYKILKLYAYGNTNRAATTNSDLRIRFNNDTTSSNYRRAGQGNNAGNDGGDFGDVISATNYTNAPMSLEMFITNYTGSTQKNCPYVISYQNSSNDPASGTPNHVAGAGSLRYKGTSAINRIDITDVYSTFVIGSSFYLYGMA